MQKCTIDTNQPTVRAKLQIEADSVREMIVATYGFGRSKIFETELSSEDVTAVFARLIEEQSVKFLVPDHDLGELFISDMKRRLSAWKIKLEGDIVKGHGVRMPVSEFLHRVFQQSES